MKKYAIIKILPFYFRLFANFCQMLKAAYIEDDYTRIICSQLVIHKRWDWRMQSNTLVTGQIYLPVV